MTNLRARYTITELTNRNSTNSNNPDYTAREGRAKTPEPMDICIIRSVIPL